MRTINGYVGTYFQTNETEVITTHLYGVRYPDGEIRWDSNGSKTYESAATTEAGLQQWVAKLEEKARELHIDPETYSNGHTLVRRTVIISATTPEDV